MGEPPFEAAAAEAEPAVWPAQLVQRQADNCITVPAAVGRILCPDAPIDVDLAYCLPSGDDAAPPTRAALCGTPDTRTVRFALAEHGGLTPSRIMADDVIWQLDTRHDTSNGKLHAIWGSAQCLLGSTRRHMKL